MRASINERTIAWDDAGQGHAIVFVHGFPHDRTLWAHQRRALSTHARCIAPDLRGFGESMDEDFDASSIVRHVDGFADDIVALLDELEIEHATICGLSMGGYIAMSMWRRYAERIDALVLCDTRAGADGADARAARDAMIAKAREGGASAIAEAQIGKMVGATTLASRGDVVDTMRTMMARQRVGAIIGALEALRDRPDSQDTLRSITVPTLIIVGEEDTLTPPSEADAMLRLLPENAGGRIETIASAGHVSCIERPAAVTHALADFMVTLLS